MGLKSTFSTFRMSSAGSPQKYNGLSPGTLYSSLIVIWLPIHDGFAVTETALSAARKTVVSCMVRAVNVDSESSGCWL